jgi:hypothetical protein
MERNSICRLLAVCLVVSILASAADGVIKHADNDGPSDRPADGVVGKWKYNSPSSFSASCVVIDPNWVVTTRHQSTPEGSKARIGGQTYLIAEMFDHPTVDLRLGWLQTEDGGPANLVDSVPVYTGSSEAYEYTVIGGYGDQRGSTLYDDEEAYGYAWGLPNDTDAPTWGENDLQGTRYNDSTWQLKCDFDENGLTYEAAIGDHDSGSGWFVDVDVDGQWELAAIGKGVDHFDETWFDNPNKFGPNPDFFYGVRLTQYDTWIEGTIADWLIPGDANDDKLVDLVDLGILADNWGDSGLTREQGDFNGDGMADLLDLAIMADNFNYGVVGEEGSGDVNLPEPTSALLLCVGVGVLARRRRRRS